MVMVTAQLGQQRNEHAHHRREGITHSRPLLLSGAGCPAPSVCEAVRAWAMVVAACVFLHGVHSDVPVEPQCQ
jgi:hypothetical protein